MAPAIKRAFARMVRYVVIPAILVALDTLSKFARGELSTDVRVV